MGWSRKADNHENGAEGGKKKAQFDLDGEGDQNKPAAVEMLPLPALKKNVESEGQAEEPIPKKPKKLVDKEAKGMKKKGNIDVDDLWDLTKSSKSDAVSKTFNKLWKLQKGHGTVWLTIVWMIKWPLFWGMAWHVLYIMGVLSAPVLVRLIIQHIEDEDKEIWYGYIWVVLIFLASLFNAIGMNQSNQYMFRAGIKARAIMMNSVYNKCFNLSIGGRGDDGSMGAITNYMSNDAQRLLDIAPMLNFGWSAPLLIVGAMTLLYFIIGWACFVGLFIMLLLVPFNFIIVMILQNMRRASMKYSDQRIKLINEYLQGIKIIKFYSWERPLMQRLYNVRAKEFRLLVLQSVVRVLFIVILAGTPVFVAVAVFASYSLAGNELEADVVFPSLALLSVLRFPLAFLPMVVIQLGNALVSMNRIQAFLRQKELGDNGRVDADKSEYAVEMEEAEFWYLKPPEKKLSRGEKRKQKKEAKAKAKARAEAAAEAGEDAHIEEGEGDGGKYDSPAICKTSLKIKKGELVAVVGSVGSGKSSFINAILGELEQTSGKKVLAGNVSYVAQEPFIVNDTLRNNVLLGSDYDEHRYERTIMACALAADLNVLTEGDETEIGEKGINLSGGQKQRVSIARAVYRSSDIYLFDDPLSAVDSHVAQHIWEEVILGATRKQTRIMAMNQLQFLPMCDRILVVDKGEIIYNGDYKSLMDSKLDISAFIETVIDEDDEKEGQNRKNKSRGGGSVASSKKSMEKETVLEKKSQFARGKAGEGKLVKNEDSAKGSVPLSLYVRYMLSGGGVWYVGIFLVFLIALFFLMEHTLRVSGEYWLSWWVEGEFDLNTNVSLAIYVAISLLGVAGIALRSLTLQLTTMNAAKVIHEGMAKRIFRAPMSFFDTTPIGRVLNRFTRDTDWVDNMVPLTLAQYLGAGTNAVFSLFMIVVLVYWFIFPLGPLLVIYWIIQRFYRYSSIALQRLSAVKRSPVFNYFNETLMGLPTIRAYYLEGDFIRECRKRIDVDNRVYYIQQTANQWLTLRLDLIGTVVVFFTALFAVIGRDAPTGVKASQAGLALVYALEVIQFLKHATRMSIELETKMNAVERMLEYSKLEQEAPEKTSVVPPASWPKEGKVDIENLELCYRKGLDPVLRGISLQVKGGERIGVVGRTGAGKSSLMLALFRLVEASAGSIKIDGIDIASVGLQDLRSRLSIIPQDPVLFSGTLRDNLDPFGRHGDGEIWEMLNLINLAGEIRGRKGQLHSVVSENGENFSVGQRQLICLGRALLRASSVLILDEATASIDMETDALIQSMIRKQFVNCTTLTIAHRLHTIMDYDRILVLGHGKVLEYDTPRALLSNPHGHFRSMVDATGKKSAMRLEDIAYGRMDVLQALKIEADDDETASRVSHKNEGFGSRLFSRFRKSNSKK